MEKLKGYPDHTPEEDISSQPIWMDKTGNLFNSPREESSSTKSDGGSNAVEERAKEERKRKLPTWQPWLHTAVQNEEEKKKLELHFTSPLSSGATEDSPTTKKMVSTYHSVEVGRYKVNNYIEVVVRKVTPPNSDKSRNEITIEKTTQRGGVAKMYLYQSEAVRLACTLKHIFNE